MSLRAGILGASGAAGAELARLLVAHPQIALTHLYAHTQTGKKYGEIQPGIPSLANVELRAIDLDEVTELDVVFVALPHGQSAELTTALAAPENAPLVVDCGADHRLRSRSAWERYYGGPFQPPWTYGMPELATRSEILSRIQTAPEPTGDTPDIPALPPVQTGATTPATRSRELLRHSRTIAVPGCNVTAVTLALAPAIALDLVNPNHVNATAAVGYSGAGRSLKPHLMAINALNNLAPYSAAGTHRHIPEIIQNFQWVSEAETNPNPETDPHARPDATPSTPIHVDFTPILAPTSRGILAVINTTLSPHLAQQAQITPETVNTTITNAYRAAYEHEPLIDLVKDFPTTQAVLGTGRAEIWVGVNAEAGTLTAIAAIDNLGKGTASAAIQSANLALGLPELTAVPIVGVTP